MSCLFRGYRESEGGTFDLQAPVENIFVRLFKAGGLNWVGAAVPCKKSEKDVQFAARFAVEEYNKIEVVVFVSVFFPKTE